MNLYSSQDKKLQQQTPFRERAEQVWKHMPAFIEENVFKGPTLRQHKALWGKKNPGSAISNVNKENTSTRHTNYIGLSNTLCKHNALCIKVNKKT